MRTGTEVKVGLITVLASALFLVFIFYVTGYRGPARSYRVFVTFEDARGLQTGNPVHMVGVKIGEVRKVAISPDHKAEVELAIDQDRELYDNYEFRIGTTGLIEERFVEVIPEPYDPYARRLTDGARAEGILRPNLADLMQVGSGLISSLNRTSQQLNVVLSDQEVLSGITKALRDFSELAASLSKLSQESGPDILATLKATRAASTELQAMTSEVRARLAAGSTFDDLEKAARLASAAAAKADHITSTLDATISDPQLRDDLRSTIAETHRVTAALEAMISDPEVRDQFRSTIAAVNEAAQSAKRVTADLEVFSGELRAAAPVVPRVADKTERVLGTLGAVQEGLKPPDIKAAFDVLYGPEADRSFSSGYLDVKPQGQERFLRFGVDDIGEDSTVDIQLGEPQRRAVVRYGLVRSRLGVGLDFHLPREGTLSLDVFDPNNLRADILADVPLVLGRSDWSILGGVRDLGDEGYLVGGVRLKR